MHIYVRDCITALVALQKVSLPMVCFVSLCNSAFGLEVNLVLGLSFLQHLRSDSHVNNE